MANTDLLSIISVLYLLYQHNYNSLLIHIPVCLAKYQVFRKFTLHAL